MIKKQKRVGGKNFVSFKQPIKVKKLDIKNGSPEGKRV